jgi:hypothetical protein
MYFVALIMCALGVPYTLASDEAGSAALDFQRLRTTIVHAGTSAESGKAYSTLLKRADSEGLEQLMSDSNPGIALHAAWEKYVNRPMLSKGVVRPQRFLGFLEAKTKLRIPLYWEVQLVGLALQNDTDRATECLDEYLPAAPFLTKRDGIFHVDAGAFRDTDFGVHTPDSVQLTRVHGRVKIAGGERTVSIDQDLLQRLKKAHDHSYVVLQAAFIDKRVILAVYDPAGYSFPMICVDSSSGILLWESKSWGYGGDNWPIKFGQQRHTISVYGFGEHVAVFGEGAGSCYLEVWAVCTGECIYRFCSDHWGVSER